MFSPKLKESEKREEKLKTDIYNAIASNEITPYFQPVIHSSTGKILSFEALVRWIHPEYGYIIPPEIIHIAQQTELLFILTAHVMDQTIKQMQEWPNHVHFAVNVTPSQLNDELVDLVRETVRRTKINPERFEIEITEDALIKDFQFSATIISRLRAIGVAVAMDDFGSGYTSLSNLCKLDFTKIKIDKSISDGIPKDNKTIAIVNSLMLMAKELGVAVTVEGIETEDQVEFLKRFHCGIQGYVFARPMPTKDMPEMQKFLGSLKDQPEQNTVININSRTKTQDR